MMEKTMDVSAVEATSIFFYFSSKRGLPPLLKAARSGGLLE
jgi:hypothetical protein